MLIPIPCTYLLCTFHLRGCWLSAYANYCCPPISFPAYALLTVKASSTSNVNSVNHKVLPDTTRPSFCHLTVHKHMQSISHYKSMNKSNNTQVLFLQYQYLLKSTVSALILILMLASVEHQLIFHPPSQERKILNTNKTHKKVNAKQFPIYST